MEHILSRQRNLVSDRVLVSYAKADTLSLWVSVSLSGPQAVALAPTVVLIVAVTAATTAVPVTPLVAADYCNTSRVLGTWYLVGSTAVPVRVAVKAVGLRLSSG